MKMKEVCARTGLTERTIRFYVEEELIHPQMSLVNGREYRYYSEWDVAELTTIADLRKLFFSIEEIKRMKQTPDNISEVLKVYKETATEDVQAKTAILHVLDQIDLSRLNSVDSLAQRLRGISLNLPLPNRDIAPNFGQFDSETKEEREREYERYLKRQARQYTAGKVIVFTIAVLNIVNAIFSAFLDFNFIAFIIQVIISIALVAGVTWVRYLFVVGSVLSILFNFMLLAGWDESYTSGIAILIAVQMVYAITSCLLLIKSNAVSEFLYSQKNG